MRRCRSIAKNATNGKPAGIDAVVLSTQHSPDSSQSDLRELVMETIIKPVVPKKMLHAKTKYFINPTGRFVVGGPQGDSGFSAITTPAGRVADVSAKIGLKEPTLPMGCNFGDINGDGFLDMYLGTGSPDYKMIMPNKTAKTTAPNAAATRPTPRPMKYCCSVKSTFTAPKWAVYSATS